MKRAGPTFVTWMLGRLAHPLSVAKCDVCGRSTDGTGAERTPARILCANCLRARLVESLRDRAG
jgi:recombinational DNA repair protein (RecF pathway)